LSKIHVRKAKLEDASAISTLFRAKIDVWQRFDAHGKVESPPYEALTIYERWLHGGAWMSIETAVIWLNHLLRGGGLPIVITRDETVVGYGEAYLSHEAEPFGIHVHLGRWHAQTSAVQSALMDYLVALTADFANRLTVACSVYDDVQSQFFAGLGMSEIGRVRYYDISAQLGQGFYKATEHTKSNPAQIEGWQMPIGRTQSARYHWEAIFPRLWDAVEGMEAQPIHRLHVSAAGHEALVCVQGQLYDKRKADVFCWSPKSLTPPLLVALRDWAHRAGYRTLHLALDDTNAKLLGTDVDMLPNQQVIYAMNIHSEA
jgi:hypothetical protein